MRTVKKIELGITGSATRKRVAAYARVSSGKDAMLHSLSAQISYYNSYIGGRGDFEFAGVYADEALTGTKDSRPEFQRMLADCRAGKIDMIITKSITRFARNTVTLLEAARELKLLGIDIFFEKEGIHTDSADGEFILTLLASFAQEESRSASENQKWRIRKKFEVGKPATCKMFGYQMRDGQFCIVPIEAEIVKQIFAAYLSGMGLEAIAKSLNSVGAVTRYEKKWRARGVYYILRNEVYTGDLLLQKTYRLDHITKKKMINRGELPMYHVEDDHEAIVDKATFEEVQREIARRMPKNPYRPSARSPHLFSGMIRCGLCGEKYRRKITAAGSKYAKPVWICHTFDTQGKGACPSQRIPEDILLAKTSEILGTTDVDADMLRQHISSISVPAHNRMIYVFTDGRVVEASWRHTSRSESWTPEMKEAARKRRLAQLERRDSQ